MITIVGLSHKSAPIDVRERVALSQKEIPEVLARLRDGPVIGEVIVLSTCNRLEVYAAPPRQARPEDEDQALSDVGQSIAASLAQRGGRKVAQHLHQRTGMEALRHLFRVASSLDSLVVGEPQILGQLKSAIDAAREEGTVGPTLNKAMSRALHVGKRVRTETAIGAGQVSVSSVAVDLAGDIFGDLHGRVVLLIGAGEMAEAAARLLGKAGARILVANRSAERASRLAAAVGGQPRGWGELEFSLVEADIVISSTSSTEPIITKSIMKTASRARRGRSIFLIDIALPRDIDPAVHDLDNVYLYDIDNLSEIVAESLEGRASEAQKAEVLVESEVRSFEAWSMERALKPVIVGLRAKTRAVLSAELDRSFTSKLKHLSDEDRDALRKMVDAATNKLCHQPTTRLKELVGDPRGDEYVDALRDLYDLPELDADNPALDSIPPPKSSAPRSVRPSRRPRRDD